jgi:hypothetical protein
MNKKYRKNEEKMKARTVFVRCMLVCVVLSLLVGVSGATWCDTDYAKRINVSVNNTGGSALTDYQVYVNLSTNPINETSIRVYNSAVPGSAWMNDTSIYYNNNTMISTSNGITTFPFFDNFNYNSGGLTKLWSLSSGATQQKSIPFKLYDYNDDGRVDIYSVDSDGGHFYVFDYNGTELVNETITMHYGSSSRTCGLTVQDINNDGNEEIIFTEDYSYQSANPSYVRVINTTGYELWNKSFSSWGEAMSIQAANFTATSGLEIAVACGNASGGRIYMLDKDGNEEWVYEHGLWAECRGLDYGDFDGDGQNDICSIDGAGSGFVVLYGHNGTKMWDMTSGNGGETFDVQDINSDGEDDILYGSELGIYMYWGNGTLYWSKATSDDAEWVTFSNETINGDWIIVSTGRHQHLYVLYQNGTEISDTNLGSNSWTGAIHDLNDDGAYEIVVGEDTGYVLNVYNFSGTELATISGAGHTRHIEANGSNIFISSRSNPNQYAVYNYTTPELPNKWTITGSPTVENGVVEINNTDTMKGKTSFTVGHAIISNANSTEQDSTFVGLVNSTEVEYIKIQSNDGSTRCGDNNFDCLCWYSKVQNYDAGCVDGLLDFRTAFYNYEITWLNNKIQCLQNSTEFANYTGANISTDNLYPYFRVWDSSAESVLTVDWVLVRKYASPEPSAILGSEEDVHRLGRKPNSTQSRIVFKRV